MLFKKINFCIVLLLMSYSFATRVYADCAGSGCTCKIAATNVVFGSYNPFNSTALSSTGTVSVTCSALLVGLNVSYIIGLAKGSAPNFSPRMMKNGANQLNYNLYTNALRSIIWGEINVPGTNTVSDNYLLNLISVTRNYSVYGLLPALQNVVPGDYSDSITATVTF